MFQATADGYIQKKQNYGTSCDGSREQSRHAYVEGLVPRHNVAAHRRRLADEVVPVHGRANKGRQQLLRAASVLCPAFLDGSGGSDGSAAAPATEQPRWHAPEDGAAVLHADRDANYNRARMRSRRRGSNFHSALRARLGVGRARHSCCHVCQLPQ